uniref:Uncharacterized protein n=1 Tax=viral metagenome TaxID=1070528 RepID=A0A6M3LJ13_9ZZZZ
MPATNNLISAMLRLCMGIDVGDSRDFSATHCLDVQPPARYQQRKGKPFAVIKEFEPNKAKSISRDCNVIHRWAADSWADEYRWYWEHVAEIEADYHRRYRKEERP